MTPKNIRWRAFKTLTTEPENFQSGGIFQIALYIQKSPVPKPNEYTKNAGEVK